MTLLYYIIGFIIVALLLARSGAGSVKNLKNLGAFLGLSEFTIAFIVMAMATSLPEFFVGVGAALNQTPELSLGNLIGTNIVNLTLIIGIIALALGGVSLRHKMVSRNLVPSLAVGFLPFILLLDKSLSRIDGFILFLTFLVYIIVLFRRRDKMGKSKSELGLRGVFKSLLFFTISIIVLLGSAGLIVYLGQKIALILNLPLVIIGFIGLALSTSLPELAFGWKAARNFSKEMNLGNILGSTVANVTFILGITALICPIEIQNPLLILLAGLFTLFVFILFFIFCRTNKSISRIEGFFLIALYLVFVAMQILGMKF